MVYLVSRFARPLSRNLDFRVLWCLRLVLLISRAVVHVFTRFLFLHLPHTSLCHLLESHGVPRSHCPSASPSATFPHWHLQAHTVSLQPRTVEFSSDPQM
ncbi:hypothetical protein EDC04DRAFT_2816588 [Pisolithus marmoratus]|nr:hypothetical protein EDC04DRAFT_2816588 [Pisolithus marmoratus]